MSQTATPIESYWKTQSDSLRDVRENLNPTYQPLSDDHPLLKSSKTNPKRRKSDSSKHLPRASPGKVSPSVRKPAQRSPSLRGAKYDVVPPLNPRTAFTSPNPGDTGAEHDSWGEEEEEGEDEGGMYPDPRYPYPLMMYPMIVAPHPSMTPPRPREKKAKGNQPKKKVQYRNTPTYLTSRENTKHEPQTAREDLFDPRSNSVLARYQLHHISPRPNSHMDSPIRAEIDPEFIPDYADYFINHYLQNVVHEIIIEAVTDKEPSLPVDHPLYVPSFRVAEELLREEVPKLVEEVVLESTNSLVTGTANNKLEAYHVMAEFLNDLVDEAIAKEVQSVVKETTQGLVDDHLEEAAIYDNVTDIATDLMSDIGPDLVEEALREILLEDYIDDAITSRVLREEAENIAVETLTHYSDKVRSRDIREMNKLATDKLQDSLCLDFLLALIVRQGELWTEGEHANRLLDDMMLSTILNEYFGVNEKKRMTVDNKPVRRYYEKIVTDVMSDVLVEELSKNLDEDMADLDEYERGVEQPNLEYQMPADLKKWFEGK